MKKIFTILFALISFSCFAENIKTDFTMKVFKQAQNEGKTVVVYSWNKFCTTCARQKPILKQAKKDFENVIFLNYEQTKNADIAKYLDISYWSTIAVFKDNKELARGIGLIKKEKIYSLIQKGT